MLALVTIHAAAAIAAVILAAVALMMADPSIPGLQDAALTATLALPAAASTTVTSTGIDLGVSSGSSCQIGSPDWLLTVPALNTTQLPDSKTCTYAVIVSASADMGTPTTLFTGIVQTGAGGAAASTFRFRIPPVLPGTASRYIGFTAVTGSGTGDCSASKATLQMLV